VLELLRRGNDDDDDDDDDDVIAADADIFFSLYCVFLFFFFEQTRKGQKKELKISHKETQNFTRRERKYFSSVTLRNYRDRSKDRIEREDSFSLLSG